MAMRSGRPGGFVPIPMARVRERLDRLVDWKDYAAAAAHLEYWLTEARAAGDGRGEFAVLNEMMGVYRRLDSPEKAMACADAAAAMADAPDFRDSFAAGVALVNAGTVCVYCGVPGKALPFFEEARRILEGTADGNDPRLGGLYNNMALALTALGRYGEAYALCRSALEVMGRQVNGGLEQAVTYLNMADIAEASEGMEAAEDRIGGWLEKAGALLSDPALPRNGYTAFVYEKCAPSFSHYGWFALAAELEREALRIREGMDGEAGGDER